MSRWLYLCNVKLSYHLLCICRQNLMVLLGKSKALLT